MDISIAGYTISPPSADDLRIACLIWGMPGSGKTTLASTAPGVKLWLNFDPDGLLSLIGREDVVALDLSGKTHLITERLKDDNPFQLEQVLRDNPSIETVVFDSLTAFSMLATDNAVAKYAKPGKNQISMEAPGQVGYTHRNALTLRAFVSLLRLTKRMGKHFVAVSHEGAPVTDDDGNILFIPPALSDSLRGQIGLSLNECWHIDQDDKGVRRILVRPARKYKPMKTRLWLTDQSPEFVWRYDANTATGDGIKEWFEAWQKNKGQRLPLPK